MLQVVMELWLSGSSMEMLTEANNLVQASCAVLREATAHILPVPTCPHYRFSVRDVFRVFRSLLMADPGCRATPHRLSALWYHEMLRVMYDRLLDTELQTWFMEMVCSTMASYDVSLDKKAIGDADGQEVLFCSYLRGRGDTYRPVFPFDDPVADQTRAELAAKKAEETARVQAEEEAALIAAAASVAATDGETTDTQDAKPSQRGPSARKSKMTRSKSAKHGARNSDTGPAAEPSQPAAEGAAAANSTGLDDATAGAAPTPAQATGATTEQASAAKKDTREAAKGKEGSGQDRPEGDGSTLWKKPLLTEPEIQQKRARILSDLQAATPGTPTSPLLCELIDCYQVSQAALWCRPPAVR